MPRALLADTIAEVAKSRLRPVLLASFQFTARVGFWTGTDDIPFDGIVFQAVGQFGSVSPVNETAEIRAVKQDFALSGLDSAIVAVILSEHYQGKLAKLWLGFLRDNGTLVADPVLMFAGRMDVAELVDIGAKITVKIRAESRLIELTRAPIRRYTNRDQLQEFPGDFGLEFVEEMQEKRVTWPDAE